MHCNITPDSGGDDILDLNIDENHQSILSDVASYVYKNGRQYNIGDSDELDASDIDIGQHIYGLLFGGKLVFSPKSHFERILDVGAGTGKWAMDMAVACPEAEVTGVDLCPIEPPSNLKNVSFDILDANQAWGLSPDFDLVHVQGMAGEIVDWETLCSDAYKTLKPGGFFEAKDIILSLNCDDSSIPSQSPLWQLEKEIEKSKEQTGHLARPNCFMESNLKSAGFVDIECQVFHVPMNTWPENVDMQELGKFRNVQLLLANETYFTTLSNIRGMEDDHIISLLSDAKEEINNRRRHGYHPVYVWTARKPE